MYLSGVDIQLPDVVEHLFAGWSHPAVEPPVAPIAVLQVHMLVPAGSIVKFLWTVWTRCLFMNSKMNLKTSHCTTVHV